MEGGTAPRSGPLSGLRVVELAALGPAPHAAMVLADLGADVIRVDRPGERFDFADPEHDGLLRNRTWVRLDLKQRAGVEELLNLIEHADVLVEGFRPGVLERLGIGPAICLERNPQLVIGRVTGWGQDGPRARQPGHDINYLAVSGVLSALGGAEKPCPPANLVGDFGGGSMLLLVGILAALQERTVSGLGQVVDAAMVDGIALLSQNIWSFRNQGLWHDERASNLLDGGAPFYTTYVCADGKHVAVGALEPKFYAALLEGLGLDTGDLPAQLDRSGWGRLRDIFAGRFATKTRDEWDDIFEHIEGCVTPVVELEEVHGEKHLLVRRTYRETASGTEAAPAPRFSRSITSDLRSDSRAYKDVALMVEQWTPDE